MTRTTMPESGDHEGLPPDLAARLAEEDAKADLEMERVLAMTDEEVMKELEAEGRTREKVEADAVAMAERVPALAAKLVAEEEEREREAKRATSRAAAPVASRAVAEAPRPAPSPLARSYGKEMLESGRGARARGRSRITRRTSPPSMAARS
jgi:hypothetical protein